MYIPKHFNFCIYQTFFFLVKMDPSLYINVMFIVVHLFFEIVTALFQIPREPLHK